MRLVFLFLFWIWKKKTRLVRQSIVKPQAIHHPVKQITAKAFLGITVTPQLFEVLLHGTSHIFVDKSD